MRLKSVLVVLLSFAVAGVAYGQEDRGRINGLVTDASGAVVPKASVTLLNEGTGVSVSTVSDSAGAYIFEFVLPGVYTVKATSLGFKQFTATHVRVEVAAHVGVPVKLEIGAQTEVVTVEGTGGARLKTEDAALGYTIEQRMITDLPSLYGSSFEFQLLAPGVTSTTLANGNHTYEGGSESAKINGSQSGQTEFTLDGAPDSRNGGAVTTAYVPSRDFIGEFRLITSPYDASLSHTSGGSLDASIKSGTKQFHGGASWFWQPSGVDAPAFSLGTTPGAAPVATYNRESGEIDGPILRSKLFFFTGYERQYNSSAASTTTQTVPTPAEKTGDFSALLGINKTLVTNTVRCKVGSTTYFAAPYNVYQIWNPYVTTPDPNCPGQYLRTAYNNNIITNIDPVAKKILGYYPDPTGSAVQTADGQSNFVSNVSNVDHYWSSTSRLDYNLSDRQKLFGHFIISERTQPGKNAFFPNASGQTLTLKNKAFVLDYVNTLNTTTVLNARYSLTRFTTVTSLDAQTTATDLGVNPNALAGSNSLAKGFPQVKITGYATLGNSDPGYEADNIHAAQINLTKSLNRHQAKFGVEWREYQANKADLTGEHLSISATGTYTKGPGSVAPTTAPIGQGLASLESGLSESTQMTLNAATANNTDYWSGYFQDDWKALPNLTINMGLRYEYGSPVRERNNKSITGFDFGATNPIAAQATANYTANPASILPVANFKVLGGLDYATPGGKNQDLWVGQKNNFSPRVGFAFSPTSKLVIRGGFGIFYSHLGEYVQYGTPTGFTQSTSTVPTLNNGQTFIATLQNPFPNGLVQPSGASNGLLQSVGQTITFIPQHPKNPYSERYSLGIQYQLPGDIIFEVDYVGSTAQHVRITRDYDPLPNSYLSTDTTRTPAQVLNNTALTKLYTNPFAGITVPGSSNLTQAQIAGTQLLKPYPEFTGITANDPSGFSSYNALQLSAQKRFSHGYNLSVAYTQSQALDAISFLNPGDAKPWYGVSNGDYPRVLSVAGIYELPFGKGKPFLGNAPWFVDQLIRGFQVEGTYRVQSGQPLTFNNAAAVLRPGATLSDFGKVSSRNIGQWFNRKIFINAIDDGATTYTATSLQSNLRTYPLRFNNARQDYQDLLNVGAVKKFTVMKERVNMVLRAEALNALNHPVYNAPSTDPSSTNFGVVTGYGNSARVLQFAVEGHF
jgi:hypothetical protein